MKVLSCQQMRKLEQAAVEHGQTYLGLMEQAGTGAAKVIREQAKRLQKAIVFCGKGNNGGDGFVIARRLQEWGAYITVVLMEGSPATPDAAHMFAQMKQVEVLSFQDEQVFSRLAQADIVVDAVYGIGFRGSMRGEFAPIVEAINQSKAQIFAVDLPSGAQGDSGKVEGSCIRADITITFTSLKPAHVLYPSSDFCGNVVTIPVGIPEELLAESPCVMEVTGKDRISSILPIRMASSHKGTYGTLLSVCGSRGMAGAAIMSGRSALRCGVGLVKMAIPQGIYPILAGAVTEPVFVLLQETRQGTLSRQCKANLLSALSTSSACLIGCGMGCNADTEELVKALLMETQVPIILDADGINAVCAHIDSIKTAGVPVILTPHPGEMARLLHTTIAQVQSERYTCARQFAMDFHAIVVLKGANTLIALPDGKVFVNRTGNPGMARGGSGDVLAGMIGAFVAQGIAPEDAAICGVYLHGLAGDRCAAKFSQVGMLPTDMIQELPSLFLEFGR